MLLSQTSDSVVLGKRVICKQGALLLRITPQILHEHPFHTLTPHSQTVAAISFAISTPNTRLQQCYEESENLRVSPYFSTSRTIAYLAVICRNIFNLNFVQRRLQSGFVSTVVSVFPYHDCLVPSKYNAVL